MSESTGEISAYHNALTNLPNRNWLMQRLGEYTWTYQGNFALIFADIDGLKQINDSQGHAEGDKLLVRAGEAFENTLRHGKGRETDEIGFATVHLSGDEFVLLLPGVSHQSQVDTVIARAKKNLEEKGVGASFGGRPHVPGESSTDLLASVDALMYDAKQARKLQRIESLPWRKRTAYKLARKALEYSGINDLR
jgi:diguanylate cyclase (GGDEF)-like protein